jgi:hypothetical protein
MRARSFALLVSSCALAALVPACTATPTLVPLRSMERPKDVDFICLEAKADGSWAGASLDKCAISQTDGAAVGKGAFRLHAVVTQVSRGELAVADIGATPGDSINLLKVDPRIPGYSFLPTVAAPVDVVADPMGTAVFVASGRDARIDVIPAGILRGPIDSTAASTDTPPWPHLDFDRAADGLPGAMTIVREGDARRLFVTLPDAKGGPKLAVFGLGDGPVPAFVGYVTLTAGAAPALPWKKLECGSAKSTETWWAAYDRCAGETPRIPSGEAVASAADSHFAGVASAAGKLFVADDRAGFVHVFAIKGGAGVEEVRIPIGSPTARLAISPVVPDEVTLLNGKAIDQCIARGWLGDGLDHGAESALVREQLGGRCRAHRYLYAIDLVNAEAGAGSIAIVDLPVLYTNAGGTTAESLDLAGAELVQPMACDGPTFPGRRMPVGPFALNAANVVPARSIAFVQYDPPNGTNKFVPAARCRPWPSRGADELQGVPADERDARFALGEAWRTGVDPTRMRGTYAWVALANGAIVAVDVDDYDSLCRGPNNNDERGTLFRRADEDAESAIVAGFVGGDGKTATATRTGEYYPRVVDRHHVRTLRFMKDAAMKPAVGGVTLSRYDAVLGNDPGSEAGSRYPHLATLSKFDASANPRPALVEPAPDNPFTIVSESWTVTFEGQIPGFSGTFGRLSTEGANVVLTDPAAGFCRRGVETRGPVETHDVVQLTDPVCEGVACDEATRGRCLATFGAADAKPLKRERSFIVEKAFDGRFVLANKTFQTKVGEGYALVDGAPDLATLEACFGKGVVRYTVRANGASPAGAPWVVVGSSTGYTHRWTIDEASGDAKACVLDPKKPRVLDARAAQAPALTGTLKATALVDNPLTELCQQFANVSWRFAIRAGSSPSLQDMRFTFSGSFNWTPLSVGAGSLSASLKPVSGWWDGKEHLGWNMLAAVDAIDRGLYLFPASSPFSFQKSVN